MAFYLRKGFNFGPVRLNLSKGGVGVSGGITGARVGMSPRGAYVHGGRSGLYYRKYARKGRGRSPARFGRQGAELTGTGHDAPPRHRSPGGSAHVTAQDSYAIPDYTPGGMVEVFVDTGVTWPSPVRIRTPDVFPAPDFPRTTGLLYLAVPGLLLFFGGLAGLFGGAVTAAGLILLIGSLGAYIYIDYKNSRAAKLLNALQKELEQQKPDPENVRAILGQTTGLQGLWRKWIDFHGGYHLEQAYAEKPDQIPQSLIEKFERQTVLGREEREKLHIALFQRRFEELARDHSLTEEDERHLRELAERLDLGEHQIGEELDTLVVLSEIRREAETFPAEIEPPVRLTGGEKCYAAVPGRLLKEKVQQYRTIDRVRHKYVGFEVDMDGTVCLTNKRILIVAQGSRDYRLNRILDVILSLEDATVRLVLDGRKSPVILTMERPALFAARMQHLLDAQ